MKKYSILSILLFLSLALFCQKVSVGPNSTNNCALLEVNSNIQGFLPPRMSFIQRNQISNPIAGLVVWCSNCGPHGQLQVFNGNTWTCPCGDSALVPPLSIKICNQIWMTYNLDVTKYRNGDLIPEVKDPVQWSNLTTGAWCYFNNDSALGSVYGKLYNWYAVNDPRGLAPVGWHIPSNGEWTTLVNCLGGENIAAGKMKENDTTHWRAPNIATNSSGLSLLPGNFRYDFGYFNGAIGVFGAWWTSTPFDANEVWYWTAINEGAYTGNYYFGGVKKKGLAVRCIKD